MAKAIFVTGTGTDAVSYTHLGDAGTGFESSGGEGVSDGEG